MASKTLIYFPTVRMIGRCYNQLHLDNMTAQVCVYHGSLSKEEKQENYEKFRAGEKLVMLATKAFGMGVDIRISRSWRTLLPPATCATMCRKSAVRPGILGCKARRITSTTPTTSSTSIRSMGFHGFRNIS